jgi:hypothetical protein
MAYWRRSFSVVGKRRFHVSVKWEEGLAGMSLHETETKRSVTNPVLSNFTIQIVAGFSNESFSPSFPGTLEHWLSWAAHILSSSYVANLR